MLQIVPQPMTNLNDLLMGPLRWINFSSDNHIWGLSHRCHGKNNDGLATDNQSTSSIKMNVPDSNFGRALCFVFESWAQLETFFRKRDWAEKKLALHISLQTTKWTRGSRVECFNSSVLTATVLVSIFVDWNSSAWLVCT